MRTTEIGVLIRTYDNYIDNLKPLLESLADYYTVVGYDKSRIEPADDIKACANQFFIHESVSEGWTRKQEGDRAIRIRGMALLDYQEMSHVLSCTGDVTIDNPENIPLLLDDLGDEDIIGVQWWDICGDLIMFGRADKMHRVFADIPGGRPQGEIKMMTAFHRNSIKYAIHRLTKEDAGIWAKIGYRRGNGNYPPPM